MPFPAISLDVECGELQRFAGAQNSLTFLASQPDATCPALKSSPEVVCYELHPYLMLMKDCAPECLCPVIPPATHHPVLLFEVVPLKPSVYDGILSLKFSLTAIRSPLHG